MKKVVLSLGFLLGLSIASYACDAARSGIDLEVEKFGKFESFDHMIEAWEAWVEVAY